MMNCGLSLFLALLGIPPYYELWSLSLLPCWGYHCMMNCGLSLSLALLGIPLYDELWYLSLSCLVGDTTVL